MKRLLGWISALGGRVNPIAVKEFRQAVRSHMVVAVLILLLLVDLVILGAYLLRSVGGSSGPQNGRDAFQAFMAVLLVACLGFVPLYAGVRLSIERNDVNLDLLYVTTIPPGAVIRGKYLTATALTLLIFSACMPFIVLTYLLRGIDLPSIFYVLAMGFLFCSVANAIGVFFGCLPGSWLLRGLAVAAMVGVQYYAVALMIELTESALRFGVGRTRGGWEFWAGFGSFVLVVLLGIGLLHVMSVALISPKASNRMLVPRVYVTGAWAVVGALMAAWSGHSMDPGYVEIWAFGFGVLFAILALLALGERDAWNRRVRRAIPRNPVLRVPAFLLYTGSAGGVAWATLMFAATLGGALALHGDSAYPWHSTGFAERLGNLALFFGYILCYCLSTAFLRVISLKGISTVYLPVVALILMAVLSLGPYLILILIAGSGLSHYDSPACLLASPMILAAWRSPEIESMVVPFVVGWTLLGAVASLPWFAGQWQRFVPYRASGGNREGER